MNRNDGQDYSVKKLAWEIFNKEKWWDILSKFIYVLRMNIFIVDKYGYVILPPDEAKFGGKFYMERTLGFDLLHDIEDPIRGFVKHGKFYEYVDNFNLHIFAVPVHSGGQLLAYIMVGPVVIPRKLDLRQYRELAAKYGADEDILLECLNEVRAVSHIMMNAILELLGEIIKDNIELSVKEESLNQLRIDQDDRLGKEFKDFAKEIYATVRVDELLVTLLDLALSMTNTECGSIMIVDEKSGEMTVKVARGLDKEMINTARVKLGGSVAGIAAKENKEFVINHSWPADGITPYLKRPEIRNALIMPLTSKDKIFGVLNVHTKTMNDKINENLDNLRHLTKLMASAF